MGVRIEIFAVDEPRFEALIENSIGTALQQYFQHGTDSANHLYFWDVPRELEFIAYPLTKFSIRTLRAPFEERVVEWDELKSDPFLSTKLGDYLSSDSDVGLSIFLSRFSECRNVDFIRNISSGYRRWWIGSLLDYAEKAGDVSAQDYAEVAAIFQKMLRGYECGKFLPLTDWKPNKGIFPVLPGEVSEMGVWTADETQRVLQFVHSLLRKAEPNFAKPPGKIGIAVETDAEWNEWVRFMIKQLLTIEGLKFDRLKVVSFIS